MISDLLKYLAFRPIVREALRRRFGSFDEDIFDDAYLTGFPKFEDSLNAEIVNQSDSPQKVELAYLRTIVGNEYYKILKIELRKNPLIKASEIEKFDKGEAEDDPTVWDKQNEDSLSFSDFLFKNLINNQLLKNRDIDNKLFLQKVGRNNSPLFRRKFWSYNKKIAEEDVKKISSEKLDNFDDVSSFKNFKPWPIIRLECWVAFSKL